MQRDVVDRAVIVRSSAQVLKISAFPGLSEVLGKFIKLDTDHGNRGACPHFFDFSGCPSRHADVKGSDFLFVKEDRAEELFDLLRGHWRQRCTRHANTNGKS